MVEYVDNKLCVEAGWMVDEGIVSYDTYKNYAKRNKIRVLRRGCRNTPAMIDYESMPERLKREVVNKIGHHPYEEVRRSQLEMAIEHDAELARFFDEHTFNNGRRLPKETKIEYYNNAIVLRGIHRMLTEKKALWKAKGKRLTVNWNEVSEGCRELNRKLYGHTLPANARRLQDKYKEFVKEGPGVLIHKNFNNTNAARIEEGINEDMALMLISDQRQLSNTRIMRLYNTVAEGMGWGKITAGTVANLREKFDTTTYGRRRGVTAFSNKKAMMVKRSRPTAPLYYLTLDGWDAELMYRNVKTNEKTGHSSTTYHNRATVVVVLDPVCKYPLGYAVGENESPALIKAALRNAMQHTRELFGRMYRAHQLQSDRYQIKAMLPLYGGIAEKVTPARAHNAKAKVIEPWFKYLNTKYCQMELNWSGYGITTNPENQPNPDFLNKIKKHFPDFEGVCFQIQGMIEAERSELRDAYLKMWAEVKDEDKIEFSEESYLMYFGERTSRTILMQPTGLHPMILGQRRDYECFDLSFRDHLSVQWTVRYDPDNLQKILVTNESESLRYVMEEKYVQPMALKDRKPGDAQALQRVRDFNEALTEKVSNRIAEMENNVQDFIHMLPQLETINRLMITDSKGQHKDHKKSRKPIADITDILSIGGGLVPEDNEEDNLYNLY